MILRTATDIAGLATMLNEFASSCYDHGVLATHSHSSLFETSDLLSIVTDGRTVAITGFDAFDEDITEDEAAARIETLLAPRAGATATVVAGDACIVIGPGRPFARATRPTRDVLVIETGGAWPARMIVVVDRLRGIVDTGRLAA